MGIYCKGLHLKIGFPAAGWDSIPDRYDRPMTRNLVFGDPEQQKDFHDRNSSFFDRFHRLERAFNAAFDRNAEVTTHADKAIYL